VKWPGRETDRSLPSSAEVRGPHASAWRSAKLSMHRAKFTFRIFYSDEK
jgi:hypothetical protein